MTLGVCELGYHRSDFAPHFVPLGRGRSG